MPRPYVSLKVGIPELLVGPIPSCFLPHARSATSALAYDLALALCQTLVIPTTTVMKGRSLVHSLLAEPPKVKQEVKLTSKDHKTEDRFFATDGHVLFIAHTYSFTTTMGPLHSEPISTLGAGQQMVHKWHQCVVSKENNCSSNIYANKHEATICNKYEEENVKGALCGCNGPETSRGRHPRTLEQLS